MILLMSRLATAISEAAALREKEEDHRVSNVANVAIISELSSKVETLQDQLTV